MSRATCFDINSLASRAGAIIATSSATPEVPFKPARGLKSTGLRIRLFAHFQSVLLATGPVIQLGFVTTPAACLAPAIIRPPIPPVMPPTTAPIAASFSISPVSTDPFCAFWVNIDVPALEIAPPRAPNTTMVKGPPATDRALMPIPSATSPAPARYSQFSPNHFLVLSQAFLANTARLFQATFAPSTALFHRPFAVSVAAR
ncbi:Uncharacterised protein [Mycobacterium tuberculosis]|nr:Uncharacterised protein [Mycobacterium tuberculosis]